MDITQAPHGINVVVETDDTVYIGRLGKLEGDQVRLHHAAVLRSEAQADTEHQIRLAAKYGIVVEHRDLSFETTGIRRIRRLGDIPKA